MDTARRTRHLLQGVARAIVVTAVILSAWLFASAEPWAYLLVYELAGVGIALWLFSLICWPDVRIRVPGLTFVLLGLGVFIFVQALPLGLPVVSALNPFSAGVRRAALDVFEQIGIERFWPDAGAALSGGATLSLSSGATWRSLRLFALYVGTFLVMANTTRRWRQADGVASAIVVSGFVMAIVALIHKHSGSKDILWIYAPRYGGNLFGPFTTRNHFGAHMNMLFGLALGLLLCSSRLGEAMAWPQWRDRVAWLSTKRASRAALAAFAVMLLGGSACVSLSRGAIISLVASVGLTGGLVMLRYRKSLGARLAVLAVLLLVLGSLVWLGWEPVFSRLGTLPGILADAPRRARSVMTWDTLRIFGACPITGSGFGTFRHVCPIFQSVATDRRWYYAHNDWAQLFAEGGLIGAALFLLAVALWCRNVRTLFPGASNRASLFSLGVLVGVVAVALHSFVDFSLHRPANAMLLAAMAGLCVGVLHIRGAAPEVKAEESAEDEEVAKADDAKPGRKASGAHGEGKRNVVRLVALILLVLLTVSLIGGQREFRGELAFVRFLYACRMAEKVRHLPQYDQAVANVHEEGGLVLRWGRNNPDALRDVAVHSFGWILDPRLPASLRLRVAERAAEGASLAVAGAPSDYLTWLWLGRSQAALGDWDGAADSVDRARALVTYDEGITIFGRQRR